MLLEGVAGFTETDAFIILPGGKERYFADAYSKFAYARNKTLTLGLTEFADGDEYAATVQIMKDSFCEKYGFYVSSDDFDVIEFDNFIRHAETGKKYYIGGTVGYHF
jgi:hypothetical protein